MSWRRAPEESQYSTGARLLQDDQSTTRAVKGDPVSELNSVVRLVNLLEVSYGHRQGPAPEKNALANV